MNYALMNGGMVIPPQNNNPTSEVLKCFAAMSGLISANIIAHEILRQNPEIDVLIPGVFAAASMTYLVSDGSVGTIAIVTGLFYALYHMFFKKQNRYVNPRKSTTLPPSTLDFPRLPKPKADEPIQRQEILTEIGSLGMMAADMTYGSFNG
jgi:hypothetical protein